MEKPALACHFVAFPMQHSHQWTPTWRSSHEDVWPGARGVFRRWGGRHDDERRCCRRRRESKRAKRIVRKGMTRVSLCSSLSLPLARPALSPISVLSQLGFSLQVILQRVSQKVRVLAILLTLLSFLVRGARKGVAFLLVAPSSPPLPTKRSSRSTRSRRSRVRARGITTTEPPLVPLVVALARPLLFFSPLHRDGRGVGLQQRAREPRADGVVAGGHDRVEPGVDVLGPPLGLALGRQAPGRRRRGGGGRGRWRSVGQRRTRSSRWLRESRPGRERPRRRRRRRRGRRRSRARIRIRARRRRRCRRIHRRSRGRNHRESKLLPREGMEKAWYQSRTGVQSSCCSTTPTFARHRRRRRRRNSRRRRWSRPWARHGAHCARAQGGCRSGDPNSGALIERVR